MSKSSNSRDLYNGTQGTPTNFNSLMVHEQLRAAEKRPPKITGGGGGGLSSGSGSGDNIIGSYIFLAVVFVLICYAWG
ncbi:hypothetical protein ACSSV1_004895 [Labrenzia sp. MBR-25]